MKIALVSGLMLDNHYEHQILEMEKYLSDDYDLVCFGESYLQGFDGLSWDYEEDIQRAVDKNGQTIRVIRDLAKTYHCAISFGFIEKEGDIIYSSNMFIGKDGTIVDVYRRVSLGWKELNVSSMYQEGEGFHIFEYLGKRFALAICGDLWHDHFLKEVENLDIDILLWPLYVDFSMERWESEEKEAYTKRTENIKAPVLMINSYVEDKNRANGGCFVFHQGKLEQVLDMGHQGLLVFEIDDDKS